MAALLTLWVAFAILCAYIADRRNAGAGRWFLFGLLFGVFALIALLATTKQESRT